MIFSNNQEVGSSLKSQLFTGGITQEPYLATSPTAILQDDHPLFTAQDLPTSFPDLIRRWRELDTSDNPFPELFRLASVPDLPGRARFLYLVEALEALHGYENREEDEDRKSRHKEKRASLLEKIQEKLDKDCLKTAKEIISPRPIDSLERRIKGLFEMTPTAIIDRTAHEPSDPIIIHYSSGGKAITFQEIIRRLRNDLSHGNYNPPDHELIPWTKRLDRLSKAQLLRLLGFDSGLIEAKLGAADPFSSQR